VEIHWPEMAQEIGSGESLEAGRLRGTTIRLGAQESGWRGVAVALRDCMGLRVADAEVDAEWMRSGCGVDAEWIAERTRLRWLGGKYWRHRLRRWPSATRSPVLRRRRWLNLL